MFSKRTRLLRSISTSRGASKRNVQAMIIFLVCFKSSSMWTGYTSYPCRGEAFFNSLAATRAAGCATAAPILNDGQGTGGKSWNCFCSSCVSIAGIDFLTMKQIEQGRLSRPQCDPCVLPYALQHLKVHGCCAATDPINMYEYLKTEQAVLQRCYGTLHVN